MREKSENFMKKSKIKFTILIMLCLMLTLSSAAPLGARVVTVEKDQVNVRQGASTTTEIIGKVNKNMMFGWYGAEENWTQIKLDDGKLGYIRNDLLQGYDEVTVTGSTVRIRKSPSLEGEIMGQAGRGESLAALDYQQGWFKVQYGQDTGWISGDYVKLGTAVVLTSSQTAEQESPGQAHNMDSVTVSTGNPGGILSGKIITLDPGHGVRSDGGPVDPGAKGVNLGIWEKDVNLDVAFKLKAILEEMGATVWMTHTGATSLNLYGRAAVANDNGSHIFVSIHANASTSPQHSGHSVYYYAPASNPRFSGRRELTKALAQFVQDSLVNICGRANLGIIESNFVVVRETNCPSILVETAFLSNAEEEQLLAQGEFRQKLATAVAQGIKKYFGVE
ncbi:MAG: N-acetylmuramoyl-L-alanine amidase [Clostridiales bacterium]